MQVWNYILYGHILYSAYLTRQCNVGKCKKATLKFYTTSSSAIISKQWNRNQIMKVNCSSMRNENSFEAGTHFTFRRIALTSWGPLTIESSPFKCKEEKWLNTANWLFKYLVDFSALLGRKGDSIFVATTCQNQFEAAACQVQTVL